MTDNLLTPHPPLGIARDAFFTRPLTWLNTLRLPSAQKALKRAIAQGHITPFYQPFVDAKTGLIAGVEVLARWTDPRYGMISPEIFIPLAEKHRLIGPLTHALIQRVIVDLQSQIPLFPRGIAICINISAQNCLDPTFEADIGELLQTFASNQSHIVIEITERDPLHFTPQMSEWFAALRRADISVALDDFGTGYSNLSYISALNPELIKIDKMFVSQIGINGDTRLIDSVIALANNMQLKIIAEGVETQAQVDYLRMKRIDFMQGFYFCKPLAATEFIHLMTNEITAENTGALENRIHL